MVRQAVSAQLALVPLLGLAVFFPFLRISSSFFEQSDGGELLVLGLELGFLVCALFDRNLRLPDPLRLRPRFGWLLLIWFAWAIGATFFSDHPARALLRQSEWFAHLLTAAVLWAWLRAHPGRTRLLAAAVPCGFLLLGMWVVAKLLWGIAPAERNGIEVPGFDNLRHYGYYAVAAVAFLVAQPTRRPASTRSHLAAGIPMVAAWTLLLWSGSRGAVVATVGSLVVLWLARVDRAWKTCIALAAVAALVGAAFSTQLPHPSSSHGMAQMFRQSALVGEVPEAIPTLDYITNGRARLWSHVTPLALERPFFGHGPDGYLYTGALGTRSEQPHSIFLQFFFEWGVVGAMAALALLGLFVLRQFATAKRRASEPQADPNRAARLGGLGAVVALLILSLFDGSLHHGFSLSLFAIALAISAQAEREPAPAASADGSLRAIYGVAVACVTTVFVLHGFVQLALANPKLPAPGAARTQLVRAFPTRVEAVGDGWSVFYWAADWSKTQPSLAIDWLHWGHEQTREPWRFYQLEGRLRLAQGNLESARWHFEQALAHAFKPEKRAASQRFLAWTETLEREGCAPGTPDAVRGATVYNLEKQPYRMNIPPGIEPCPAGPNLAVPPGPHPD